MATENAPDTELRSLVRSHQGGWLEIWEGDPDRLVWLHRSTMGVSDELSRPHPSHLRPEEIAAENPKEPPC